MSGIFIREKQTENNFNHMVIKSANTKLIDLLLHGEIAYNKFNA